MEKVLGLLEKLILKKRIFFKDVCSRKKNSKRKKEHEKFHVKGKMVYLSSSAFFTTTWE